MRQGDVAPMNRVKPELIGKALCSLAISGENNEPAGFLVDAMNDFERALLEALTGLLEQGAGLVSVVRNGAYPRRLFDDHDLGVEVDDLEAFGRCRAMFLGGRPGSV